MNRLRQLTPSKLGIAMFVVVVAVFGSLMGATFASAQPHAAHQAPSASSSPRLLPCQLGGRSCIHIGFTKAWLNGKTVNLGYSHRFFCRRPPSSGAPSRCEVGAASRVNPPSGPVVSPIRTVTPVGFTPPKSTLQCPVVGHCIDHPSRIDLSRLFGSSSSNVALPPHSHILIDDESFQSTWWPLIVVGVTNRGAWNKIVAAKSEAAVRACQAAGKCTPDIPTNTFLFFQVLGPGMSPQGPG